MTGFLHFIAGWMALGCAVGLFLTLTESYLAHRRKLVYKGLPQGFLRFAFWWPVNIVLALSAYLRGKSIAEVVGQTLEPRKPSIPPDILRRWQPFLTDSGEAWAFLRTTQDEDSWMPSHTITHPPNGSYMGWRYCIEAEDHIPLTVTDALEEAQEACESDVEWLALCEPGREKEQLAYFRNLQEKLAEPEEDE